MKQLKGGKIRKSKKCPICDVVFVTNQHLDCHISSVHKENKPFSCSACEFNSACKQSVDQHVMEVHENTVPKCK